jgi:thymidylate synthase (FAD)
LNLINRKNNIFGDEIAFVEQYDFSTANMSEENRIKAITQVASICYQNPKAVGSESLYNRLLAESKGLPSSSFEFVPVLLTAKKLRKIGSIINKEIYVKHDFEYNVTKFGEMIKDGEFLLTNLRALIADVGEYAKEFYNTPDECEIIKQHFKVFLYKVDLPTRSQMVRHRVSWQELSRRYVSGERVPFEFYLTEKLANIKYTYQYKYKDSRLDFTITPDELISMSLCLYFEALEKGVKPQEARRIIPQAAYTQIWGAFQPKQLENYFKLRLDESAQWEVQQTAVAMQELIEKGNTNGI